MRNRFNIAAKKAELERADALASVHLAVEAARKVPTLPTRRIALTALLACGYQRPTKENAPDLPVRGA